MNGAHGGADEPFDVAAEMRPAQWSVFQSNSIFLGGTRKGFGMKLRRIVQMKGFREACHGPRNSDVPVCQPVIFWQDGVGQN